MGLVNEVVEPDELEERVLELAGEIAAQRARCRWRATSA